MRLLVVGPASATHGLTSGADNRTPYTPPPLLERTAAWVRGDGPEPYSLTEGAQDQQLALAIEQAADSDTTVTTSCEAWN
jgi:hypothetical protein